ncbi:MAG: VacJ family lipoprotein [Alphaproteobacteria bacterium]|nr:VacJ family lipoprotein [Alphaproteobacteria bacterium]
MLLRSFFILLLFSFSAQDYAFAQDDEFETYETSGEQEIYDPYEGLNRKVYAFNDTFDRYFFEHVARTYRTGVPEDARDAIHNFLNNLSLPVSALNSMAQGRVHNTLATLSNFLINSTIGLVGIFDVAGQKGIFYRPQDFGQTLGYYGAGNGAYLMIPFLGPSTARDFGGFLVDKAVSPVGLNLVEVGGKIKIVPTEYLIGTAALSGVDTRESLLDVIDDIRRDSFDPYATIRSAYLQKRANSIKN